MERKILAIILATVLLFTITACSGDDNSESTGGDSVTTKSESKASSILTSEEIAEKIKNLDGISEVVIMTEENDPNGTMGKKGSYIGGVFFISDWIDDSDKSYVLDDNWNRTDELEMGASNGGTIEIFNTEKEAKERDDYLATFDGTIFASGHLLHKNMVIRTSDELKASQQKQLEEAIVNALK
jgi:hypothetical protein